VTTEGRVTVIMGGVPAMTLREVRLRSADEKDARHWSRGRCWCKASHDGAETALALVAPPWDASRASGRTVP
jgi:hypothetical protein